MRTRILWTGVILCFLLPAVPKADPLPLPDLSESHMSIPWTDFQKLLEMIQEPEPEQVEPGPPVPFALTAAHYDGRIVSGSAAFDAAINFTVLDDKEWRVVPFLPASAAIEEVKIDGKPALVETEDGWHRAVLKSGGSHLLTCRVYVSLDNRTGPRSVSLAMARTPSTTLSFVIAEPDQEIKAEPASVNQMTYAADSSRLQAVLPPANAVTIRWGRRVEVEKAELRVNAEVETLVSLGERLCQVDSVVRYEILHRGVTGFKAALPKNVTVVDVTGSGLADWKAYKTGERQFVTASLNFEAKDSYALTVSYELELADASAEVMVPELEVMDVNREIGHLGVAARTNIEVEVKGAEHLGSLDVGQLPAGITNRSAAPVLFAFKYIGHPWSLKLKTTKHKDVEGLTCAADKVEITSFLTREGELVTRAAYTIRNNREQFIRIKLPENSRVFSTFRKSLPVQPARDDQGLLLIPLEKSSNNTGWAAPFTIEVIYLTQLEKLSGFLGKIDLEAPASDIMTDQMTWDIYAPEDYKYTVGQTTMRKREYHWEIVEPTADVTVINGHDVEITNGETLGSRPGKAQGDNVEYWLSTIVQAALPVRFTVPKSGTQLSFIREVIQQNTDNHVTLKYRKIWKTGLTIWRIVRLILLIVLIVLVVSWFRRRRARKKSLPPKAAAGEVGS